MIIDCICQVTETSTNDHELEMSSSTPFTRWSKH